jgi:hypothetical protein
MLETSGGKLYGLTRTGGVRDKGVLFEWDPVTRTSSKKHDFGLEDGIYPSDGLVQLEDGKICGMAVGLNDGFPGVIFTWDPLANLYTVQYYFNRESARMPRGKLLKSRNGLLYGVTEVGGKFNKGALFEWDPVSRAFTIKYEFSEKDGYDANGGLIQGEGDVLYGLTSMGGVNESGVLYKWDFKSDTYSRIIDFNVSPEGKTPMGSITQARNGKLYGTTSDGGAYKSGVLFEYDPLSKRYSKKFDFDGVKAISQVDRRLGPKHRLDSTLKVQFIIKLLARIRSGQGMIKTQCAEACHNRVGRLCERRQCNASGDKRDQ